MSSGSLNEPKTEGKILLITSGGNLKIRLWPKAAPKACRNFVRHCFEGYYDGSIFHRILPGKLIQGGDPTGTGYGGEAADGKAFANEIHSRLKFGRRGIIGMANDGAPNSNKSQFFITLGNCSWLNKKHTVFGKITGKTIFNAIEMAKTEMGENDRPLYPPKIFSTEVLINPFDDIVPHNQNNKTTQSKQIKLSSQNNQNLKNLKNQAKNKQSKHHLRNRTAFLSFNTSESEEENEKIFGKTSSVHPKKFTSAHTELKLQRDETKTDIEKEDQRDKTENGVKEKVQMNDKAFKQNKDSNDDTIELKEQTELEEQEEEVKNIKSEYKKLKNQIIRKRKERLKRRYGLLEGDKKKKENKPLTVLQKRLKKYKKRGKVNMENREEKTILELRKFSKQMHKMAVTFAKNNPERNDEENAEDDTEDWFKGGQLSFSKIPSHLYHFKVDDYEVKNMFGEKKK